MYNHNRENVIYLLHNTTLINVSVILYISVVQHMPTGAGGGGKGRPSSPAVAKITSIYN